MGRQESHHIPGAPAGQVRIPDPLELRLADALDLQKAVGFLVQDVEGVVTEGVVDLLAVLGPMPLICPEDRYPTMPSLVGVMISSYPSTSNWTPYLLSRAQRPFSS